MTKITHAKNDNFLYFENLANFDFFRFKGDTYMKISYSPTDNAICVEDETIYTISNYDEVEDLNVTITFEN